MTQTVLALIYTVFACGLLIHAKTFEDRGIYVIATMESWLLASYMLEAGKSGAISPLLAVLLVIAFTAALFVLDAALARLAQKALND